MKLRTKFAIFTIIYVNVEKLFFKYSVKVNVAHEPQLKS
jgi:hypothetical protein